MKKEWFNRGVRMQHQFGGIEGRNDPLEPNTWAPPDFPYAVKRLSEPGTPREMKDYGLAPYREDPSPICKPNHDYATLSGPTTDQAEREARPMPVGTKTRQAGTNPRGTVMDAIDYQRIGGEKFPGIKK
jgi:hypothetical protein